MKQLLHILSIIAASAAALENADLTESTAPTPVTAGETTAASVGRGAGEGVGRGAGEGVGVNGGRISLPISFLEWNYSYPTPNGLSESQSSASLVIKAAANIGASQSAGSLVASLQIGGQTVRLLLDSGSAVTWAQGFNPSKSSTYSEAPNSEKKYVFADGSAVTCILHTDTFSFGPALSLPNQQFCQASSVTGSAAASNQNQFDGIMGIGPSSTVFASLASKGYNSISFWFNTSNIAVAQPSKLAGQVSFGDLDTSKYIGSLLALPASKTQTSLWQVSAEGIANADGSVIFQFDAGAQVALDTGTTYMYLPQAAVDAINVGLYGAQKGVDGSYTLPCSSISATSSPLSFYFASSKTPLTLPAQSLFMQVSNSRSVCRSIILPSDQLQGTNANTFFIGVWFLQNFYVSYDISTNGGMVSFGTSMQPTGRIVGTVNGGPPRPAALDDVAKTNAVITSQPPSSNTSLTSSKVFWIVLGSCLGVLGLLILTFGVLLWRFPRFRKSVVDVLYMVIPKTSPSFFYRKKGGGNGDDADSVVEEGNGQGARSIFGVSEKKVDTEKEGHLKDMDLYLHASTDNGATPVDLDTYILPPPSTPSKDEMSPHDHRQTIGFLQPALAVPVPDMPRKSNVRPSINNQALDIPVLSGSSQATPVNSANTVMNLDYYSRPSSPNHLAPGRSPSPLPRARSPAPRSTSPMPHRAVSPAPRSQSPLPPAPVLLQVTPATMARPVSTALAPTDSSLKPVLQPPPRRSSNASLLVPGQLPPRRSSSGGIHGSPKLASPQPVSPASPPVAIPPRKASSVVAFEPPLINRRKGSVAPPMTLMPLSEDEEDMKRQSRNFSHPQPVPLIPPSFANSTASPSNVNTFSSSSADHAQHSNGEASAKPPPLAFQSPVQVDPEDGTYAYDSLFRSYD